MIKLAVMSDLHVGLAARSKDLCPEPPTNSRKKRAKYNSKIDDTYRQKFVQFIQGEGITADYLVLPGDLTNEAHPKEVELVSIFIMQAADALGVLYDKIVFAPGNHDVDRSVLDPNDSTGVRWEQRYDPMGHSSFHFRTLVDLGKGDVFLPPHFVLWTFDDLLVVAYNSASHDNPLEEQHIDHGLADPVHLEAIRTCLDSIGSSDGRLRLFLVHHHPIDFTNPIPTTPDFSLMTNAENLLSLLHEHGFDLLIHGHKHHPRFETHSTQTYPHLPILCSGSFSIDIDTEWVGTIANQFHLVKVDCRATTGNCIKGKIESWANYHAKGWFPSEESFCGIQHITPFGKYLMPAELDALLEPFISEKLARYDCVLWKHVLNQFPELKYLPVNSAEAAFQRLASKLDCEIYLNTAINGLMLSKKED